MTTTPEIGDTVHYTSHGSRDGTYPSTCRAAIVTELVPATEVVPGVYEDDNALALAVLNPTGMFFNTHIPWAAYVGDLTPGGTWHWQHELEKPCLQVPCANVPETVPEMFKRPVAEASEHD